MSVIAECVNSKKLSKKLIDQPESLKFIFFGLVYSPTLTEFVFEAILTRFKANAEFYNLFFEACAKVLLFMDETQVQSLKPDILKQFLKRKEILDQLSEIKHRAFDFLEEILK
jgi:DNA polymerase I-like protein with 3'-5' exonuclease and polymerase domains